MAENDFIELMELFAEKHPSIQDNKQNRWRRFTKSGENIFTETTKATGAIDVKNFCLILCPELFQTTTAEKEGKYEDYISVNFEVAKATSVDDSAQIAIIQEQAKEIAESIWRELLYYRKKVIAPFNTRIKIESVSKNRTSGGVHNLCGYRYEITFKMPIDGITNTFNPFSTLL